MTRTPAPPVDCDQCGRRIGARRVHYVATTATPLVVVCVRCLGRGAHARIYPACPEQWHDMHDHDLSFASRAAVAWLLAQPTGDPA
jgi:hypothetical protein